LVLSCTDGILTASGSLHGGLAATIAYLGVNGRRLALSNDEAYDLIVAVASGASSEVSVIADRIRSASEPR